MNELQKYDLNFDDAYAYTHYCLTDVNVLSTGLVKLINSNNGMFFTLLPADAKIENINNFQHCEILESVRDRVILFILNKLILNKKLLCVFDDITSDYTSEYNDPLFLSNGYSLDKEMYYLANYKTATPQLLKTCFYISESGWHSLCVLSEIDFSDKKEKNLTFQEIQNICVKAQLIILGAYDSEGFIFWEKSK
jgi:hypothetical protein